MNDEPFVLLTNLILFSIDFKISKTRYCNNAYQFYIESEVRFYFLIYEKNLGKRNIYFQKNLNIQESFDLR
jgi:hypothetical protein